MPKLSRRNAIGGGLALSAVGAAGYNFGWFSESEAPGSRGVDFGAALPKARSDLNLLIVMVDQERIWDTLPTNLQMPNHWRIAERGTQFNNMNVTTPLCTPSRSVFWTGQHVQHTKVQDNTNVPIIGRALSAAVPTLGHMMRDAGFYTAYKGKWHLHELPIEEGWEAAIDRPYALEDYGYSDYGWGPELIDTQHGWKFDGRIADDAAKWLTSTAAGLDQPWSLTVSFVNPHDIMFFDATGRQAQSRVQNIFPGPVLPAPDDPIYRTETTSSLPRNFRSPDYPGQVPAQADYERFENYLYGELPHEDVEAWTRFTNYYYNCILDVDRHIGTVLDALEASGQADRTVIVLVSDHGEMGGVHGLSQKGPWMYRENLNVPFVVSHPDARSPNENDGVVSAIDFTPTMLGLVGMDHDKVIERYSAIRGKDISGDVTNRSTARSRSGEGALITYSVSHHGDPEFSKANLANQNVESAFDRFKNSASAGFLPDTSARNFMRRIVCDDFKFARYFSARDHHVPESFDQLTERNDLELFDLRNDPGETTNMATQSDTATEQISRLNTKLNSLVALEVGPDDGRDLPGPNFYWRG